MNLERTYHKLSRARQHLAAERENLIADPLIPPLRADGTVPPILPAPSEWPPTTIHLDGGPMVITPDMKVVKIPSWVKSARQHQHQLSRAWTAAAVASAGALAGSVTGTGAMLAMFDALTWHAIVPAITCAGWAVVTGVFAGFARGAHRRAKQTGDPT